MFPVLLKISHFFYHPIYREGDNEDYTPLCELVEQSQHLQCFGINVHTREDNSPLRLLNAISKSNIESLRFQHCSVTRFFFERCCKHDQKHEMFEKTSVDHCS